MPLIMSFGLKRAIRCSALNSARHRNRLYLLWFAGVTLATPAIAGQEMSLPQIQGDVVRGEFTQAKYLAELQQPLISSGHFVVARGLGLIWQVEKPVVSTLVIGQTQLVQSTNGHESLRIDADKQPGLNVVAVLLLAVFQADVARLRDFFEVTAQHDDTHWSLQLQPKTPAVARFIKTLKIDGGASVERIQINEAGGDRSVIRLHNATPDPAGLSAAEKAGFSGG